MPLSMQKVKLMAEEIEFYHNKEGLLKHQANVEAGKNIQALELELELLREQHEKGICLQFAMIYYQQCVF